VIATHAIFSVAIRRYVVVLKIGMTRANPLPIVDPNSHPTPLRLCPRSFDGNLREVPLISVGISRVVRLVLIQEEFRVSFHLFDLW
jgi:hypothetical protein